MMKGNNHNAMRVSDTIVVGFPMLFIIFAERGRMYSLCDRVDAWFRFFKSFKASRLSVLSNIYY